MASFGFDLSLIRRGYLDRQYLSSLTLFGVHFSLSVVSLRGEDKRRIFVESNFFFLVVYE